MITLLAVSSFFILGISWLILSFNPRLWKRLNDGEAKGIYKLSNYFFTLTALWFSGLTIMGFLCVTPDLPEMVRNMFGLILIAPGFLVAGALCELAENKYKSKDKRAKEEIIRWVHDVERIQREKGVIDTDEYRKRYDALKKKTNHWLGASERNWWRFFTWDEWVAYQSYDTLLNRASVGRQSPKQTTNLC